MKRELGIARCGLACCLCSENVKCKGCGQDGFLELDWCKDAEWCENRKCCIAKDITSCYECGEKDCRKGLFAEKIKPLGFIPLLHIMAIMVSDSHPITRQGKMKPTTNT